MSDHVTVPLLDLKAQYETIRAEVEPVIREVVEAQWFIMGPKVQAFEEAVADYCGAKYAVGCASGSDAILLALMALNIGPGDEVLLPAYTFFATAGSVHRLGAKPVFVDIDPTTYNMDLDDARKQAAACSNLKAIMPVHLYGQAVDMDAYNALGAELGVPVIEDAAQAIGSRDTKGRRVGALGAIGCFSFFPSKNLGGFGDGGMITTNDEGIAELIRDLRNHGMRPKYYHHTVGLNSRLDALQAAVLHVKLNHLENWHDGRAENASFYDSKFARAGALTSQTPLSEGGDLPIRTPLASPSPSRHIYNQYVIRVPEPMRDPLRDHMSERKIGTEIYYPVPLHLQESFEFLGGKAGDLPVCEQAAKETIALPIYPELSDEQRNAVAQTVIEFVGSQVTANA